MNSKTQQKTLAVDLHSEQAGLFQQRYERGAANPYADCFSYSRYRLRRWLDRILPRDGGGRRVLDVGCGTGHQVAELRKRDFDACGVDASKEMLRLARENNPSADIRYSDVESIDFPDATFDFVICLEVLRYLPDPAKCVAEIRRVLKPGGVATVTALPLFNANGFLLVNRIAGARAARNKQYVRQFFATSFGLRRSFLRQGFSRAEVHGVYTGPVNWIERVYAPAVGPVLRAWENIDGVLADLGPLREFSNMFVVCAMR